MGKNNGNMVNIESYEASRIGTRVDKELRHLAISHDKTSKSLERFLSSIVDCQEGGYVAYVDPIQAEYLTQIAYMYEDLNKLLKAANSYGHKPLTPKDIPSDVRRALKNIKNEV